MYLNFRHIIPPHTTTAYRFAVGTAHSPSGLGKQTLSIFYSFNLLFNVSLYSKLVKPYLMEG
jgi:hypothetical protein